MNRHGTINLFTGLTLHTGHMFAECLDKNDGEHFRPAIQTLSFTLTVGLVAFTWLLIMVPAIRAVKPQEFFESLKPRVHVLFTPTNASWLNQAESLLQAFSTRYLTRGSWYSRTQMIEQYYREHGRVQSTFAHPYRLAMDM